MTDKNPYSIASCLKTLHASAARTNLDAGIAGADAISTTDVSIVSSGENISGPDGGCPSGASDIRLDL